MAPKAANKKDGKGPSSAPTPTPVPAQRPTRSALETVTTAWALLALAAVASPVSQMNLSPVYGSIPAAIYHEKGASLVALLAYIAYSSARKNNQAINARDYIAPVAYYVPVVQSLLFSYSGILGPRYGPLITEAATYFPMLLLTFIAATTVLQDLPLAQYGSRVAVATPAVASYLAFTFLERTATMFLPAIVGKSDFYTRTGLQLLIASFSALLSKSTLLFFVVPAMLHTLFTNPHHYSTKTTKLLNMTLSAHQYNILDRHDSITGYISILENTKDGFRAMRCDHSILGGEWEVTPERELSGQHVKETIYSVFTMLEAVRMMKTDVFVPDEERDALFIGLGIGTAPKAFLQHGINTTIVEIDPIVHDYATKYFDLPTNHTKVISDAVSWVAEESVAHPESYDYIVHDVFTGGAEPTPLFTLEFLQGLDSLLKEDGSIAINYAGDITLPPPRIVLNTIFAVFPSCRIYRDTVPDEDAETFLNMIVFCKKSADYITFRAAKNEDYLDSMARRTFLPPDDGLEIKLAEIGGLEKRWTENDVLKRGGEEVVEKFHQEAAVRHWWIMRKVMPDAIWELW